MTFDLGSTFFGWNNCSVKADMRNRFYSFFEIPFLSLFSLRLFDVFIE